MSDLLYDHEFDATVTSLEVSPPKMRRGGSQAHDRWDRADFLLFGIVAAAAATPIAGLTFLYGMAARVAWDLGHWPSYGHPDPQDLPNALIDAADTFGLLASASVLAALTAAIGFGLSRFARPDRIPTTSGIVVATCWVGGCALVLGDPIGVVVWLLD